MCFLIALAISACCCSTCCLSYLCWLRVHSTDGWLINDEVCARSPLVQSLGTVNRVCAQVRCVLTVVGHLEFVNCQFLQQFVLHSFCYFHSFCRAAFRLPDDSGGAGVAFVEVTLHSVSGKQCGRIAERT